MILEDFLSLLLRIGELAFSATVAGINGAFLHANRGGSAWDEKRFIYTEVVAAVSILFSLLFLLPFASSFFHWPGDFILFALWLVAFILLANFNHSVNCGSIWNWNGLTGKSECSRFKATLAFSFLALVFFFVSGLLGIWVAHRRRRTTSTKHEVHRRRWYRSSRY